MLKYFKRAKPAKEKSPAQEDKRNSEVALPAVAGSESDPNKALVISEPAAESATGPATPVLDDEDEKFLQSLTTPSISEDDDAVGRRPPLPPRVKTPDLEWDEDTESFRRIQGKDEKPLKEKPTFAKKANRLSIFRRKAKTEKDTALEPSRLTVPAANSELDREKNDMARVLDDLNLAARNNKAFSLSAESTELVRKFTVVLKDLVNGVPTAANDLKSLLDDTNGTLAKNYEKLPKSLKKLVTQLPTKLSTTFAPELLAVAAEVQGISKEEAAAKGGLKGAAKSVFAPKNAADLITKPGAVAGMLKAIVNALKVRWPAFIGTNVLWSVAVFLLLFVLWYCHKRGREVRLEREKTETETEGKAETEGKDETKAKEGGEAIVVTDATPSEPEATTASAPGNSSSRPAASITN